MNALVPVKQRSWFSKALTAIRHPRPAWGFGRLLKRTRFDYRREVGDALDSSVVTAPIQWIQRAIPEARLTVVQRKDDGNVAEQANHPMLQLIQQPNPYYGDIALWAGTILSHRTDGNAYWIKVRNGVGRPVELWYIPHWLMEPKSEPGSTELIDWYEYSPGGGVPPMRLERADVVHFRCGINPRNPMKGLSPLSGVLREIFMDLEASNFVASLLRNMGVPGVVISPKGGALPANEDVQATKTWFQEAFGGDNRGAPLVMGAPTEVSSYGFNPQQMNMGEARDVAEERVCACLGIPAAVVGFGAGLQTAKVGATMGELFANAWRNGVLPVARELADELDRSLLPDFVNSSGLKSLWNTDEVLALQEDENKQEDRWVKRLGSGAITVYEYRQGIGMDADDSHRFYLRPISSIEIPAGQAPGTGGPGRLPIQPLPGVTGEPPKQLTGRKEQASEQAMKRGEAYLAMLARQEKGLSDAFEKVLTPFFDRLGQAARGIAAPLLPAAIEPQVGKAAGEKAAGDDELIGKIMELLGIPQWQAEFGQDYGAHYLEVAKAVNNAAERAGLGTNLPDPVARAVVAAGGRRAGLLDLDQQTRQALFNALAEGRAEGEGVQAMADRIELYVEGGPWNTAQIRAQIIARTETKYAQNVSTIERARAAGIASFIVFDGRFGLPRSTPSHIARNGSIVTADDAMTMAATEHPNGTLSFAPNFGE